MAKKSIGDLHATVTADAVQFVNEFKRADNEAKRSAASIKKTLGQQFGDEIGKTGKKFALSFLGGAALGAIIGQLRDVSRNIDSIPNVPADTIESIRLMNYEFAQANKQIQQGAASLLGFAAKGANLVGGIAGAIAGGGNMADVWEGLDQLNAEAEAFARSGFNKQLGELNAELDRLNKGFKGESFDDLEQEAAVLEELGTTGVLNLERYTNAKLAAMQAQFSAQGGITQADQDQAALDAIRARIRIQQAENDALKDYENTLNETYELRQRDRLSILSTSQAIEAQTAKIAALYAQLGKANQMPEGIESKKLATKITKDIGQAESELFRLEKSVRTASQEIAGAFSGAFDSLANEIADFVVDGEFKLSNFTDQIAKQVISTVAKLAIINPILNGMFGGTKGWQSLPSLFGFADGGRPPVGRASMVGEEGMELFVPDTAGTIIPNHALAGIGGAGGKGDTYIIDARGADAGQLVRLEQQIIALNGSIEKRAVGAVMDSKKRGNRNL